MAGSTGILDANFVESKKGIGRIFELEIWRFWKADSFGFFG
jgi:hypothetical protein